MLAAAIRGPEVLTMAMTPEEHAGWLLLADAVQCLQHLREAFSERPK